MGSSEPKGTDLASFAYEGLAPSEASCIGFPSKEQLMCPKSLSFMHCYPVLVSTALHAVVSML